MTELSTNLSQTTNKVKSFLSRMLSATDWHRLWDNPDLGEIVNDLRKSGLSAETCQKAKLIPISYWLRNSTFDEPTKRAFLKELLGVSSTIINGQDLLEHELLGFPYFTADGELAFVRVRSYPPLTFQKGGKPKEVRYLQPSGAPAKPYILPEVWSVAHKPHKPVWLTEGEKKSLALLQRGEFAIAFSGVWNFRAGEETQGVLEEDRWLWNELQAFNWAGRMVYLAFDADLWTNPQVRMALFELALKLYSLGAIVKVPLWDRKLKGVDDYLASHPDSLQELESKAKAWTELVQAEDLDAVVRALSLVYDRLDPIRWEQVSKQLCKRLKVSDKSLWLAVEKEKQTTTHEDIPEELKAKALEVLEGDLIKELLADLGRLYAGREKEKLLLYLTAMSRKVKNLPLNLMVVLRGNSSVGKSSLVRAVLSFINHEDVLEISYQSKTYLYYGVKDLSHRVLWLTELEGSAKGLYGLKLALTEGELVIRSVEATKNGLKPINRVIPCQSMPVITTGVSPVLDEELQTRAIVLSLVFDTELGGKALELKSLTPRETIRQVIALWKGIDKLIEPAEVVIPYMPRLVEVMKERIWAERILRDWDKFIGLVMASALVHQHKRARTEDGKVIASEEDYRIAYNLQELFTESFGGLPKDIEVVVQTLKELLAGAEEEKETTKAELVKALAERSGRSDRTVRAWIERAVKLGYVGTSGKGKAGAKVYLKLEDLPQPQLPFPEPEEIFKDSERLPNCLINPKALPDNALNEASAFCPILTHCPINGEDHQPNKAIGQNESKEACPISNLDSQGFEPNEAMRQESHKQFSQSQPTEQDYLTALERELKDLKRLYGDRARNMTYYYNQARKEWELIDGVQVVMTLPVCNGLSVIEAVSQLRNAFSERFDLWREEDELPF